MFESVITTVLNKFLGDYVANLEKKQLNLGLFSGDVELKNLELKKEALDKLNLPIEVFYGFLGTLKLKIPWRNLKTEPVCVVIEDLFLLAGPRTETTFDAEMEAEREMKAKQEKLETAELFQNSVPVDEEEKDEGFVAQLVTKIVDNLQITVKNIHIRFEDSTSNHERMFSVGLVLRNLNAVSTDENWVETFIVNPQVAVNKLVKLESFAAYWDTKVDSYQNIGFDKFVQRCRAEMFSRDHSFILDPVSAVGKATLNKKQEVDVAKNLLKFAFDCFNINLNMDQYFDILSVLAALSSATRALPYRKYKPLSNPILPEELFKYAVTCTMSDIHERNSKRKWSYIMERRVDRKNYIKLYAGKLISGSINSEDAELLHSLEKKLEIDDILQYRSLARIHAKKTIEAQPKSRFGWVWGWFGGGSASNASNLISEQDIKELYETIDYSEDQSSQNSEMKTHKLFQIDVKLDKGSLSVFESAHSNVYMASLEFLDLLFTFVNRPDTLRVDFAMGDLVLSETMIENSHFNQLIHGKKTSKTNNSLLSISYDQLTTNPNADADVNVTILPLVIVLNTLAVGQLFAHFVNNRTLPLLKAVQDEAKSTIQDIGTRTRANLQMALETHKGFNLCLDFSAPIILIPEDPSNKSKSLFVVDLGNFHAQSSLVSMEEKLKIQNSKHQLSEQEIKEFHSLLYDKIAMDVANIAAYFCYSVAGYEEIDGNLNEIERRIFEKIDLKLMFENCISSSADLASIKLHASIPEIILSFSDFELEKMFIILNNLLVSLPSMDSAPSSPLVKGDVFADSFEGNEFDQKNGDIFAADKFYDALEDIRNNPIAAINEENIDDLGLYLSTQIGEFSVNLLKYDAEKRETLPISSIVAKKLAFSLSNYQTEKCIEASLAALDVFSYSNASSRTHIMYSKTSTDLDNDLLSITLHLMENDSPKFSGINQDICINLSSISLILDPSSIYPIAEFFAKSILPKLDLLNTAAAEEKSVAAKFQDNYEASDKLKVSFAFSLFKIHVHDSKRKLSIIKGEHVNFELWTKGDKIRFDAEFESLVATDDKERTIFFFEGASVAKMSFESLIVDHSSNIKLPSNLMIRFGAMQIVYIPDRIISLIVCTFKFLKISDLFSSHPDDKPEEHAQDQKHSRAAVTFLDIELESPVIYLPRTLKQQDPKCLRINLGNLKISNEFIAVPKQENKYDQQFNMLLTDVFMSLQDKVESVTKNSRKILSNFDIPIKLYMADPYFDESHDFADIEVDSSIESVAFSMNRHDYADFMEIFMNTINSLSRVTASLPQDPKSAKTSSASTTTTTKAQIRKTTFDGEFFIKSISMNLLDQGDVDKLHLSANEINVLATMQNDDSMQVAINLGYIQVVDMSLVDHVYNKFFVVGNGGDDSFADSAPLLSPKHQIALQMNRESNGSSKLDIYVESPKVFAIFDSIFFLLSFISSKTSSQVAEVKSPANTKQGPNELAEPGMEINLNIVDSKVLLIENIVEGKGELLTLEIGNFAFLQSNAGDIDLALTEFSTFIKNATSSAESKIHIFENFSTTLSLKSYENISELLLSLTPVIVTLSFQDLQLLLKLSNAMNESRQKYLEPPIESVSLPSSPDSVPLKSPTGKGEEGQIIIPSIRIIVIDDSEQHIEPLIDIALDHIVFSLSNWSSALSLSFKSQLSMFCFDPKKSYWEPMIEPWKFSARMGYLPEVEKNSSSTVIIYSEQGLDVLLVHQSIERILQVSQKLFSEEHQGSHFLREVSSEFRFGNYLPHNIEISNIHDGNEKVFMIASQEMKRIEFLNWRELRSSLFSKTTRINVKIADLVMTNLAIDSNGLFKKELFFETGDSPAEDGQEPDEIIFVQCLYESGLRTIYFRSKYLIHNQTDQEFLFSFEGKEEGKSIQIDPNQLGCIPSHLEQASMSFFPLICENSVLDLVDLCEWSECDGKVFNYYCPLTNSCYNVLLSFSSDLLYPSVIDVYVRSPLEIENLISAPIELQLKQGDQNSQIHMEHSDSKTIYSIDPSIGYTVALSIPSLSFYSTNIVQISAAKKTDELSLQTADGLELKMMISQSRMQNGVVVLTLSAYYFVVNQTKWSIQIESNTHFKATNLPAPQTFDIPACAENSPAYSFFSHPNVNKIKNRARIRVGDANWSEPLSFEAVGSECEIVCKSMLTNKYYNVGVYVGLGEGKFAMTKVVYIVPRVIVVNNTKHPILLHDSSDQIEIKAGSQTSIHLDPSNFESVSFKLDPSHDLSSPFDIKTAGTIHVRLPALDDKKVEDDLCRISKVLKSPTLFVSFDLTNTWPITIVNDTLIPFTFHQKNVEKVYEAIPESSCNYSWDQPQFSEKLLIVEIGSKKISFDAAQIGKSTRFKIRDIEGKSEYLNGDILSEGPTSVIKISYRYRERSLSASSLSSAGSEGSASDVQYSEKISNAFVLKIPHLGISLIDPNLREIVYIYIKEISVRHAVSQEYISYGLTIKWIQIDNQLFDWEHPMLLYPAVITKAELKDHPFLNIGVIQSTNKSYGVTYYKYLGLLMQECSIEIGEKLLYNLVDFASFNTLLNTSTIISAKDYFVPVFESAKDSSEILFFEIFQLHPLKINVTFSRSHTDAEDNDDDSTSYNPLKTLVNVLTMTIGNISDAPLQFNALVLENVLSRQEGLQETIISHYKRDGISQIHKVLGSADFLGNPVGLISTLGSGVTDLFYEPYQGFVSDRPQDIGIGFARGGASLVKKTIVGFSGTFSKITGSLAKGLSVATFDKSYQQQRRLDSARNKPKHALSGVTTGVKQLMTGISSGLTGVFDKPIEGAKEGGVGGFFKGIGVGLAGAITKPVVGVIDMTSSLSEGIRGSADDSQNTLTQIRFPRVIPFDNRIPQYSLREAFGQSILVGVLGPTKIGNQRYIAHFEVTEKGQLLIITSSNIILASVQNLNCEWKYPLASIIEFSNASQYLMLKFLYKGRKFTKIIPSTDDPSKTWFIKTLKRFQDSIQ